MVPSIEHNHSDKTVSFADREYNEIYHKYYDDDEYSCVPEKTDTWYTSGDFHHFRCRDYRLMKFLSTKKIHPRVIESQYNDSIRGLMDNKGKDSKFNRQSCCAVVLAGSAALHDLRTSAPDLMALVEEEKQGGQDEDILAHVYGLACTSSVQKAIDRAASDSKFVDEYIRYHDDVDFANYETSRRRVLKNTDGRSFMGIDLSSLMCSSFLALAA